MLAQPLPQALLFLPMLLRLISRIRQMGPVIIEERPVDMYQNLYMGFACY